VTGDRGREKRLAAAVERIRTVARTCGYAIAVHGSQTRDLDLIAAPWTVEAVSAQALVDALCDEVPLVVREAEPPVEGSPEAKPWGRLAWALHGVSVPNVHYVDLSVVPRAGEAVPLRLAPSLSGGHGGGQP
jgi:hypothetical protein